VLEEQIETEKKYTGPNNILIPGNDFLQAFFQSVTPYMRHSEEQVTHAVAMLKVKEAILLLLYTMPELRISFSIFPSPIR